jgi:hypothetical protein
MQFSLGIASIDKPDSNGAGTFVNLIQIKFGCSAHSDQGIGPRSNRRRRILDGKLRTGARGTLSWARARLHQLNGWSNRHRRS